MPSVVNDAVFPAVVISLMLFDTAEFPCKAETRAELFQHVSLRIELEPVEQKARVGDINFCRLRISNIGQRRLTTRECNWLPCRGFLPPLIDADSKKTLSGHLETEGVWQGFFPLLPRLAPGETFTAITPFFVPPKPYSAAGAIRVAVRIQPEVPRRTLSGQNTLVLPLEHSKVNLETLKWFMEPDSNGPRINFMSVHITPSQKRGLSERREHFDSTSNIRQLIDFVVNGGEIVEANIADEKVVLEKLTEYASRMRPGAGDFVRQMLPEIARSSVGFYKEAKQRQQQNPKLES